jgi:hypothetical protein
VNRLHAAAPSLLAGASLLASRRGALMRRPHSPLLTRFPNLSPLQRPVLDFGAVEVGSSRTLLLELQNGTAATQVRQTLGGAHSL